MGPENEKSLWVTQNLQNCSEGDSIKNPPSCPLDGGPRPFAATRKHPDGDGGQGERAPPKGGYDPTPAQGCRAPGSQEPTPYAFELAEGEEAGEGAQPAGWGAGPDMVAEAVTASSSAETTFQKRYMATLHTNRTLAMTGENLNKERQASGMRTSTPFDVDTEYEQQETPLRSSPAWPQGGTAADPSAYLVSEDNSKLDTGAGGPSGTKMDTSDGQLVRCDSSRSSQHRDEFYNMKFEQRFNLPRLDNPFSTIPILQYGRGRQQTFQELFALGQQQDEEFPSLCFGAQLPSYEDAMDAEYVRSSESEGEETPLYENDPTFQDGEKNPKATPSAKRPKHPSTSSEETENRGKRFAFGVRDTEMGHSEVQENTTQERHDPQPIQLEPQAQGSAQGPPIYEVEPIQVNGEWDQWGALVDNELVRLGGVALEMQGEIETINERFSQNQAIQKQEAQGLLDKVQEKFISKANELLLKQLADLQEQCNEAPAGANAAAAAAFTNAAAAAASRLQEEANSHSAALRKQAATLGERVEREALRSETRYAEYCKDNNVKLNEFREDFYKWWKEEKRSMLQFEECLRETCRHQISKALDNQMKNFAEESGQYMNDEMKKLGRNLFSRLNEELRQVHEQVGAIRAMTPPLVAEHALDIQKLNKRLLGTEGALEAHMAACGGGAPAGLPRLVQEEVQRAVARHPPSRCTIAGLSMQSKK